MSRSARWIPVVTGAILGLLASGAGAAPIKDQAYEAAAQASMAWPLASDWQIAQTFTCGLGGSLAQVDLYMARFQSTRPVTLSVVETADGKPEGTVLASLPCNIAQLISNGSGWTTIQFAPGQVTLQAGQLYGLVVSSAEPDSNIAHWWYGASSGDHYPSGSAWQWRAIWGEWRHYSGDSLAGDEDMLFRTYTVPEPAALSLLVPALLLLRRQRREPGSVSVPRI